MNQLVIFDSLYGNTEKISQGIGQATGALVKKVTDVTQTDIQTADLLIVGSPVQGGRPTLAIQTFIDQLPANLLASKRIAVFDTRLTPQDLNFFLKLLVKTIGYAAPKLAASIKAKGGTLVGIPEGFIVAGKEGPLKPGELERAIAWAKGLI